MLIIKGYLTIAILAIQVVSMLSNSASLESTIAIAASKTSLVEHLPNSFDLLLSICDLRADRTSLTIIYCRIDFILYLTLNLWCRKHILVEAGIFGLELVVLVGPKTPTGFRAIR